MVKKNNVVSAALTIQGGVILWRVDLEDGYMGIINFGVPEEMIAKSSDEKLTVFLITDDRHEKVGTWRDETTGETYSGFREYTEIVVIYWPEKKIMGKYTIVGKEPEETEWIPSLIDEDEPLLYLIKMGEYVEGVGFPIEEGLLGDDQIEEWIASLSREDSATSSPP